MDLKQQFDSTLLFCQNPKDKDFIGLLKNWFESVENGTNKEKENE